MVRVIMWLSSAILCKKKFVLAEQLKLTFLAHTDNQMGNTEPQHAVISED